MAIYTGKTNMIDKVVVTEGAASEEMDYVYVTNAAGNRELVFEQKPPAPDDNTQTNPPILRRWSANIKVDVAGRLFWGNLSRKQFRSEVTYRLGGIGAGITKALAHTSIAYQVAPYLSLKADGKGGYTFSPKAGIRGNGWTRLDSYLRYPTESELTHLGALSPYTGTLPAFPTNSQVSGLPLSNVFNKNYDDRWTSPERKTVRRTSMVVARTRYRGQATLSITPSTPNGIYHGELEVPGVIDLIGQFTSRVRVKFTRTSDYDEILLNGYISLGGTSSNRDYSIRLKRNVVAKEEPPMSELVTVTNITRGIGGNPKAFRMGDDVNFICEVTGEYV